jgi:hypothetical protein
MNMLVAGLVFVPLLAVAIAHLAWSVGSSWPLRDRAMLARTVIGRPGVSRIPRLAALLTAIGAVAVGTTALALADKSAGGVWLTLAGALLAAAFLARGAIGYTTRWRNHFSEEPFATLDRRNYSPLSLLLGTGFLLLVGMRLL